jgi:hypothetical protein
MLATEPAAPYTVPMTPAADALHERHLADEDAWAKRVAGTPQAAIVNRLGENAAKLALISAISRNPAHPEITEAEVAWGWALAEHCARTILRDAQRFMADSEFEARLNKAINIIGKFGPCTRAPWKQGIHTHNNKNIYIIYIRGLEGSCVAALGFVWMAPQP